MNSQNINELRQNPGLKKYFPEGTSDEDVTKIVMKILKERQEMKAKPVETKEPPKPPKEPTSNKNKHEKKKPEKTCSFCHNKGHQRSKCPKRLYPGVDL